MRILAIFAASYSLAVLVSVYSGQSRFLLYPGLICAVLFLLSLLSLRRTGRQVSGDKYVELN